MITMTILDFILRTGFVSVAVLGVVGFIARTYFKRWLDKVFDKEIEAFKHAQTTEIEHLRHRFSALVDRKIKLNEIEFRILPEIWDSLTSAFSVVHSYLHPFQESSDYRLLTAERWAEAVEAMEGLTPSERKKLTGASGTERNEVWKNTFKWKRHFQVEKSFAEFHNMMISQQLFLPTDIEMEMKKLDKLMQEALLERKIDLQMDDPHHREREFTKAFLEQSSSLHEQIMRMVQARLWRDTGELPPNTPKIAGSHPP
jgi:hypothetical protein